MQTFITELAAAQNPYLESIFRLIPPESRSHQAFSIVSRQNIATAIYADAVPGSYRTFGLLSPSDQQPLGLAWAHVNELSGRVFGHDRKAALAYLRYEVEQLAATAIMLDWPARKS